MIKIPLNPNPKGLHRQARCSCHTGQNPKSGYVLKLPRSFLSTQGSSLTVTGLVKTTGTDSFEVRGDRSPVTGHSDH